MKKRERFCIWLFKTTKTPYANLKKRPEWGITRDEMTKYPAGSLGHELGSFLVENDFQPIPKLENHDVFHLITNYSTNVEDEIALQYFFLGNGKRSLYLIAVILLGALLFPETYAHFYTAFKNGKNAIPFHNWDFKQLLEQPFSAIKESIYDVKCTDDTFFYASPIY